MALLLGAMVCAGEAGAQTFGNSFTYQGRLEAAGVPMDGTVDLEFRLFSAVTGGSQVGVTVVRNAWPVAGGEFSAAMDFGVAAWDGQERYVQIAVRSPAGSGGPFVTLSPRQRIAPVPYAMVAKSLVPGANLGLGSPATAHTPLTFGNTTGGKVSLYGTATQQYGMGIQSNLFQMYTDSSASDFVFGHGTSTNFTERMRIEGSGNVGIGTNAPGAKLDVAGTGRFTGFQLTGNGAAAGRILSSNATGLATWIVPPNSSQWSTNGTNITYSTGNVGVGLSSPTSKLHVVGSDTSLLALQGSSGFGSYLSLNNTSVGGENWAAISTGASNGEGAGKLLIADQSPRVTIDTNGNVGIGTTVPTMRLTVAGTFRYASDATAAPVHTFDITSGAAIDLIGNADIYMNARGGRKHVLFNSDSGAGNVGIGTANPQEKLDVEGNIRCNVLVIDGGADVAESYDVAAAGEAAPIPGMVVSIDPDRVGKLQIATKAYDSAVAGIISGADGIAPGMILGQNGTIADGAFPIANVGRVWCYVDADAGGPVVAGDLLTTSTTPGHAMKVNDRTLSPGATIGKAMSPLPNGKGLVLVLVTLQ